MTAQSEAEKLYANDAVWAAFYRDGLNLGQIAERFGGSIYSYSPWLTAPIVRAAPIKDTTP